MDNPERTYTHHFSSSAQLNTTMEKAFSFLDDPKKLSGHMGKSSWMMAGSKMEIKLDEKQGKGVGAKIILVGQMMGIPLYVNEAVIESEWPKKKSWETKGPQKLIVLDQYKMGFRLRPEDHSVFLEVFIDYNIPRSGFGSVLGKLFAKSHARWCTERMAKDAAAHFKQSPQAEVANA